jgi:hypothetical protein
MRFIKCFAIDASPLRAAGGSALHQGAGSCQPSAVSMKEKKRAIRTEALDAARLTADS